MSVDRLAVVERALVRSRAVLSAFGVDRANEGDAAQAALSAILLCRGGRLGKLAAAAGSDVDVLCALSAAVAQEFLLAGSFDALVIDGTSLGVEARLVVEEVRRVVQLIDLPVIVVAAPFDASIYEEVGASAVVIVDELAAALKRHAGAYRAVRAAKRTLRALKAVVVGDTASGLSGRALFAAHLERIVATREAPVTLGVLKVTLPGIDEDAPLPSQVLKPIAGLLTTITRAEDVVAEIRSATFGLLFPGADVTQARRVVQRLAAVTESSAIVARDGATVLQPAVDHAVVSLDAFASVEDIWQEMRARIQEAASRRLGA